MQEKDWKWLVCRAVQYREDTHGASAVEYGLLAALIALACVASLIQLGGGLNETYKTLSDEIHTGSNYTPLGDTVVPQQTPQTPGASSNSYPNSPFSANSTCTGICASAVPTTQPAPPPQYE